MVIDQAFNCIVYIQISKKHHQIVASMKQSGKSIQLRALNRILGNIDNLDVQPYGLFVEEEQKKLNTHWSVLLVEQAASFIMPLVLFSFFFVKRQMFHAGCSWLKIFLQHMQSGKSCSHRNEM